VGLLVNKCDAVQLLSRVMTITWWVVAGWVGVVAGWVGVVAGWVVEDADCKITTEASCYMYVSDIWWVRDEYVAI